MRKIGLFGGSFNPIHEGHIAVAKAARKQFHFNEIWFLPSFSTPLKYQLQVSFVDRCHMVSLAIHPYAYMKLSRIEESLPSPSYTFNTISKLRKQFPSYEFYWIIGYDQYEQLDQWYRIEELKEIVQFVVVNRGNQHLESKFLQITDFNHPASSTAIREGDFTYLYPTVRDYIAERVLYFPDFLPKFYDEERWKHAVSVAEWSVKIAEVYRLDKNEALLAGYLHDIAKKFAKEEMLPIMETYFVEYLEVSEKVWHQYVGWYYAKYVFFIKNRRILKAILHHTTGTSDSLFSKMLYCADKIDDTRSFDTKALRELIMKDIDKGFKQVYIEAEEWRLGRKNND